MNERSLKYLKIFGLALTAFGFVLVLLSPIIGEAVVPGALWWIEPVAYIGAGVFILGALVALVSIQLATRRIEQAGDEHGRGGPGHA